MSCPVNGEKLFALYPISVVIHSMNAIADESLDLYIAVIFCIGSQYTVTVGGCD